MNCALYFSIWAKRKFQKLTNISPGTQASQRSIESHWGWVARRGNSSRQGRSQTSCQVGPLLFPGKIFSNDKSDPSRRSETGWLGALLLLCDHRPHRACALSWSSLQTSWNCCLGMAIIFCSWIWKLSFNFEICFLIFPPGRPCCSGPRHSSQPLGKQVRLFCSPKVRAHFIFCLIGEERLCWRGSWRQKTRGSSWWARFLPASRLIFELGNIIVHFFFN